MRKTGWKSENCADVAGNDAARYTRERERSTASGNRVFPPFTGPRCDANSIKSNDDVYPPTCFIIHTLRNRNEMGGERLARTLRSSYRYYAFSLLARIASLMAVVTLRNRELRFSLDGVSVFLSMRWNVDCSTNVHVHGGIGIFVVKPTIPSETFLPLRLIAFDESSIVRGKIKKRRER